MTPFQVTEHDFELVNDSVMTRTMDGIINFWNDGSEKLYGWRKEEAVGTVSHNLLQTQFPKPLQEIESELARNGLWEGKLVHTTRDGGRVVVESRWILELERQSEKVVEINIPSTDCETDGPDIDRVATGKQEAVSASQLLKADDFLPKIADIVLAAGGTLGIFIALYFMYYYGWTKQRQFTRLAGPIVYYVLPVFFGILCFASLRLLPSVKVKLGLFLVSTFVSLYAAEAFLGWAVTVPVEPDRTLWSTRGDLEEILKVAKQSGVDFDNRHRLQVVRDLEKEGVNAVPAISTSSLLSSDGNGRVKSNINIDGKEVVPLSGISDRLTVLCNEQGQWISYQSDERGFHNPTGIWNSERFEVAAVGDSFTQGYCVPSDENFIALIRKRYPATVNLGTSGQGPLATLAELKEYAQFMKPKIVLWFFYEENDFSDLRKEKKSDLLTRYLEDHFSQELFDRQPAIDKALAAYIAERVRVEGLQSLQDLPDEEASTLAEFVRLPRVRKYLGLFYGADNARANYRVTSRDDFDVLNKILLRAKATVDSWGGKLYLVYLPERQRYARSDTAYVDETNRKGFLKLAGVLNLSVIDIHSAFQSQDDPLALFPFGRLGHYNEEGHRIVAQEVLKIIPNPLNARK